jgi:GDP-mannose 6-dehydrogenase
MMAAGRSPIIEARMSELVEEGHRSGLLHATTDAVDAVRNSEISFVCVGTPSLRSGKLDLGYVERVVHEIGAALKQKKSHHVLVLRSTVLPGTTESLVIPTLEKASGLRAGTDFAVCYNPEFMREGSAVADFLQPPYTVLGAQNAKHFAAVRQLYSTISSPVFETSIPVAEMVKYVCNAFHAVKIGFANEVGTLCKGLGVDAEAVTKIYTSDTKLNISPAYLSPGFAFGGSCLPKDLRALSHRAKELDLELPLLESVLPSNALHIDRAVDAVLRTNKKKVSFLGLSFKPGTDDLRESPQVQMIKRLLGEGIQVRVWDRDVSLGRLAGSNRQYIEEVIPHIGSLLSGDLEEVVRSGELVVIATKVDKDQLARCLGRDQIVVDLINLASASRPSTTASYQGICW